jgi:xanthine dehydrogenase iron-sulfur cluster and FAD-binding subunit A
MEGLDSCGIDKYGHDCWRVLIFRDYQVSQELARCGGTQCGYCSPGIVMAMVGAKNQNEIFQYCEDKSSMVDIEDVLSGNLCRCTGFNGF